MNPQDHKKIAQLTQKALRYLGTRDRTKDEMVRYLSRKSGLSPQDPIILEVLNKLDHFNVLNDEQFAEKLAQELVDKGKGPLYIQQKLRQKGVPKSLAQKVLSNISSEVFFEAALQAALQYVSKMDHLPYPKQKQRLYRFLGSRGYLGRTIHTVIDDSRLKQVK